MKNTKLITELTAIADISITSSTHGYISRRVGDSTTK
jgi:hypothetical protein